MHAHTHTHTHTQVNIAIYSTILVQKIQQFFVEWTLKISIFVYLLLSKNVFHIFHIELFMYLNMCLSIKYCCVWRLLWPAAGLLYSRYWLLFSWSVFLFSYPKTYLSEQQNGQEKVRLEIFTHCLDSCDLGAGITVIWFGVWLQDM